MIRSGISASQAADLYGRPLYRRPAKEAPIWCAQRFGQSLTLLPDGRVVQIGGEHEDSYDPDFCIYNDVLVHRPDGTIHIFGYPESIFPPTDFHTATLVDEHIYIVGSLGYSGTRQHGVTPVYCLDTESFRIDRVQTLGDAPGWISRHRAVHAAAKRNPHFRWEDLNLRRQRGNLYRQRKVIRSRHQTAGLALRLDAFLGRSAPPLTPRYRPR